MSFTRVMRIGVIVAASAGASGLALAQPASGPWAGAVYRDLGAFEFSGNPGTRERPTPVLALSGDGQSVAFNLVQPGGAVRATVWRADGTYRFAEDPSLRFMRQALAMNYDGSMVTVSAERVAPFLNSPSSLGLRATRSTVGATIGTPQLIPGSMPLGVGVAHVPASVVFSPTLDAAVLRDVTSLPSPAGPGLFPLVGFSSAGQYGPVATPLPQAQMSISYAAGIAGDGTVIGRYRGGTDQTRRSWTRSSNGSIVPNDPLGATSFAPQRVVAGGQVVVGSAVISSAATPAYRVGIDGELRVSPPRLDGSRLGSGYAIHDASVDGTVLIGGSESDFNVTFSPSSDILAFVSVLGVTYQATDFMRRFLDLPARYNNVTFTDVSDDGLSLAGFMTDSSQSDPASGFRVFHVTIPTPGTLGVLLAGGVLASRRRRV